MSNDTANVLVGKPVVSGGVLTAPLATALPTDATTTLNVAFVGVGYISEDGVTQTIGADTSDIKSWDGSIVRKVQTSHDVTFKFTMIETNANSLKAYYGSANVTGQDVTVVAGDMPYACWAFEMLDGTEKIRIVVPNGQIVDRDDVSYKSDTAIGFGVTLEAYPDADGVKAFIYKDTA
jgi:hypothetical protein